MTVDIGDATDNGVEAEAVWRSGPHWQVRANALVSDPQIVRLSQQFPARTDAGLPGVPNQMGALDVRYSWRPWHGYRAILSAQAAYIGRSHVTFAAGSGSVEGGYATARLDAQLDTGRWRLEAYLDNAANAKGDTFAFGNPFSQSRALQVTPLRPITAGFDLAWDF
jgi:outer membrane receptor protein involved in Fe transport